MNTSGKVWGKTAPLLMTPNIEVHRIMVEPGMRCSEHAHVHKYNAFYCLDGEIDIYVRKNDYDLVDVTRLYIGDLHVVPPGEYHWFQASPNTQDEAELLELYWVDPLDHDDIVRKDVGGEV